MRYLNLWCTELPPEIDVSVGPINGAAQGMAQPEGADTTRVEVPAAAPPEYHCNKCGYLGPNQMHERPNGTGICNYFASKINGAATSGAERSSEGTGSPESRTGKPVPEVAAPPKLTPRGLCVLHPAHPHAELERLYMSDNTLACWFKSDNMTHWMPCSPLWRPRLRYYVGHILPGNTA